MIQIHTFVIFAGGISMKYKIQENSVKGRYANPSPNTPPNSYINIKDGWTDYLVSEQIIFSHRTNNQFVIVVSATLFRHILGGIVIYSVRKYYLLRHQIIGPSVFDVDICIGRSVW